jgi:hypothetical protein
MRANEFIAEGQSVGRLSKTKSYASVGLHKFVDPAHADRVYELNRIINTALPLTPEKIARITTILFRAARTQGTDNSGRY